MLCGLALEAKALKDKAAHGPVSPFGPRREWVGDKWGLDAVFVELDVGVEAIRGYFSHRIWQGREKQDEEWWWWYHKQLTTIGLDLSSLHMRGIKVLGKLFMDENFIKITYLIWEIERGSNVLLPIYDSYSVFWAYGEEMNKDVECYGKPESSCCLMELKRRNDKGDFHSFTV